jgi:putative CocE/NonD family hydrolase
MFSAALGPTTPRLPGETKIGRGRGKGWGRKERADATLNLDPKVKAGGSRILSSLLPIFWRYHHHHHHHYHHCCCRNYFIVPSLPPHLSHALTPRRLIMAISLGGKQPAYRPAHLPRPIVPGENAIKTVQQDGDMIIELNCDIPLKNGKDVTRCNVYRPANADGGLPVIMTAGPYGKDIPYSEFHKNSYAELPAQQKSKWSAWEVPEPTFWTKHGFVVVRVDEQGSGESPGFMDTMSDQTSSNFAEAIEWASEQSWSNGKVGLLGISYFAGSQWRVAARQPKGLACIIPWEGMHDYYRDRVRQGGILANGFIDFWQNRQINSNQYGLPAREARGHANLPGLSARPANIEGTLTAEQLRENRTDQTIDTAKNRFMDDPYFASRDYDLANIKVPLLSVANWGGICLHLRGNVLGYVGAATPLKWLYCITGRHDLPFYLPEYVDLQLSFLRAFLQDKDDRNWKSGPNASGGMPAVTYANRTGNPGFNSTEAERTFKVKTASAWPLPQTKYRKLSLTSDAKLAFSDQGAEGASGELKYQALTGDGFRFETALFEEETEITGYPVFDATVGVEKDENGQVPSDLDLFVTLRHFDPNGQEVFYTGE